MLLALYLLVLAAVFGGLLLLSLALPNKPKKK
jgi:hypothetical protein